MMLVTQHVHFLLQGGELIFTWLVRQMRCVVAEISYKKDRSGLPAAFINKVLLEHIHAHSFTDCLWLLLCYNGGAVVTETV